MPRDNGGRVWNDAFIHQGTPCTAGKVPETKRKTWKDCPYRHQEKHSSTNTLILDSSHQQREMTLLFNIQSWWFLIVETLGN